MGQSVVVNKVVALGEVLLVDTDRSFTGQDGYAMTRDDPGDAVPGRLAARLFALDPEIDHIWVLQNTVSVRRRGGWDEGSKQAVEAVVQGFLLFY